MVVATIIDGFAVAHPDEVVRQGGDTFIAANAASSLIDAAQRMGVKVLGMEGFLIADDGAFPALSRIADFSDENNWRSWERARDLLTSAWLAAPTVDDQMSIDAHGCHMVVIVLDEGRTDNVRLA